MWHVYKLTFLVGSTYISNVTRECVDGIIEARRQRCRKETGIQNWISSDLKLCELGKRFDLPKLSGEHII